jgi:hypothetical protein
MAEFLSVAFLRGTDNPAMAKGRFIRSCLEGHILFQGPFPPGVLSLEGMDDVINRLQNACDAARCRDVGKIAIRKSVRNEFNLGFRNVAHHLEIGAGGDVTKLQGTGYDFRKASKKNKKVTCIETYPELTVKNTRVSGTLAVQMSFVLGALLYELQISLNPNNEEDWAKYAQFTHRSNNLVTGRTPGQKYWFRARGIGATDGPWSAPVALIAL